MLIKDNGIIKMMRNQDTGQGVVRFPLLLFKIAARELHRVPSYVFFSLHSGIPSKDQHENGSAFLNCFQTP